MGDRHVQLCRGNGSRQGLLSSQGSTGNGSTSKLTHMVVGRIQSFVCCWIEGLSFLLAAGWKPPSIPCHMGPSVGQLTPWQLASLEATK